MRLTTTPPASCRLVKKIDPLRRACWDCWQLINLIHRSPCWPGSVLRCPPIRVSPYLKLRLGASPRPQILPSPLAGIGIDTSQKPFCVTSLPCFASASLKKRSSPVAVREKSGFLTTDLDRKICAELRSSAENSCRSGRTRCSRFPFANQRRINHETHQTHEKNGALFSMLQRKIAGKNACFVRKNSSDNVEYEKYGQCVRTNFSANLMTRIVSIPMPCGSRTEDEARAPNVARSRVHQ
jgi:hypothetical protein